LVTNQLLVSVIIPNHNYGRFLDTTIQSVLDQTYLNIEIIVVDNASTDNSRSVLESFGEKITCYFLDKNGQANARNFGIEKSKGKYIALLDADDYWYPEKISRQVILLNENSQFNFTGITQFDNDSGEILRVVKPRFKGQCSRYFVDYPEIAIIPGGESSAIFSRDLFDKVNGFNVELETASGRDFYRKITKFTEIDFIEEPLAFQRMHTSSMSRNLAKMTSDTIRANQIMFKDPLWDLDKKTQKKILRRLEWSFLKTWLKKFAIADSIKSMKKLITLTIKI
jgi:glycosyltransferase involved in cell wall biosynthesis